MSYCLGACSYTSRLVFCFSDPASTEIYTYGHTLSLHDALPIWGRLDHSALGHAAHLGPALYRRARHRRADHSSGVAIVRRAVWQTPSPRAAWRSEEHTSELQSLMRISYAVFCLKKKNNNKAPTS